MRNSLSLPVRIILVAAAAAALGACSSSSSSKKGMGDNGIGSLAEGDLNAMQEDRFGSGSIPSAEGGGLFRDVKFAYDSSEINDEARQNIDYNVQILRENPSVSIVLEGHCDERGTAEYNMALGQERSLAVQRVLESYGISGSRLRVISYGEEIPLAQGGDEGAYAQNRRVHFAAYNG